MNRKIITALAAAGILMGSSLPGVIPAASAAEAGAEAMQQTGQRPPRMTDEEAASRAAEMFGVDEGEVTAYLAENPRAFRDIFPCAMMARTAGRSFTEVMALYEEQGDWRSVANSLGVTREMVHETMGDVMATRIADEKTNLTKDEARTLLREGYNPRDVRAAGVLGKAAGKTARDVLSLKKINNGWDDVAKELGLDTSVLREAFRPGWMMGGPGMGMGRGPGMGMGRGPGMGGGPGMDEESEE